LYGYHDDGERFAFFSRACLDTFDLTGFRPNIVHAHDWQTALVMVYLRTVYNEVKEYTKIKSVFTLHNIEFQGKFPHSHLNDVLGIDYRYKNVLDYSNQINLVKGAIECCDMFNTVSPTYAEEIKTSQYASGLQSCVFDNAHKLVGIMNGIDYKFYNPQKDKELFENFGASNIEEGKFANKRGVQKLFQMQVDHTIPLLLYNGRLTTQKGIDLIKSSIDEILSKRIQMVVMGNGEKKYESFFDFIESKYQGKFKAVRYSNSLSKKLYAGADLLLLPSKFEPCGLSQMIASRYGTVPIVRETGGLKDSIKDFGCPSGGNGYTFANFNASDMVYSIKRGIEDFVQDGPKWEAKIKTCLKSDYSWKNPVQEYLKLYKKVQKMK
jgi:starch synthase